MCRKLSEFCRAGKRGVGGGGGRGPEKSLHVEQFYSEFKFQPKFYIFLFHNLKARFNKGSLVKMPPGNCVLSFKI